MAKLAAALSILVVVGPLAVSAIAQDDDKKRPQLMPGQYNLRLLMPTQAEERNKDVTKPASVTIEKNKLTIDTQDGVGRPLRLRGLSSKSLVKFGITSVEETRLITLHFVGAAASGTRAEGTLTIFADNKKVADGKWMLTQNAPDEKSR